MKIKEVIVVEGKDDITAVKAAIEAELIPTHGFSVVKKETLEKIRVAHERVGVIVLTDPDYAGEKIRRTVEEYVPGVKHAYIARKAGTREKDGNIGIENAKPEIIIEALKKAKCKEIEERKEFDLKDLLQNNLAGSPQSKQKREDLGIILGIGYANGKQFLSKLNHFNIKRNEFDAGLAKIEKDIK